MTSRNKIMIIRIAGSALTLGLLFLLLQRQGWGEIRRAATSITWLHLLMAAGCILLSRLAVAARWHSLLRGVDGEVRFGASLRLTFAGLFSSNFLPSTVGGDIIRLAGAPHLGVERAAVAASLLVDRLVGIFTMSFMLPFGLRDLLGYIGVSSTGLFVASVGAPGGARRFFARLRNFAQRMVTTMSLWRQRPGSLALAILASFGHMTMLFLTIASLASGVGEPMAFFEIGVLWSLIYFVSLLPFSVNGLGLQELSLTYVFHNLGGLSIGGALTLGLLFRGLQIGASLPGALFLPGLIGRSGEDGLTDLADSSGISGADTHG